MDERRYSSWVLERLALGEVTRLRFGSSTIGRHSSSVIRILDSHYVSRNHAKIEVSEDDQAVEIEDLNSVNGVFVNTELYRQSIATLRAGDQIGIGVIVDEDVNNADPEHPVFVLKHVPLLSRVLANKARPCPLSFKNHKQFVSKPTAAVNHSITSKQKSPFTGDDQEQRLVIPSTGSAKNLTNSGKNSEEKKMIYAAAARHSTSDTIAALEDMPSTSIAAARLRTSNSTESPKASATAARTASIVGTKETPETIAMAQEYITISDDDDDNDTKKLSIKENSNLLADSNTKSASSALDVPANTQNSNVALNTSNIIGNDSESKLNSNIKVLESKIVCNKGLNPKITSDDKKEHENSLNLNDRNQHNNKTSLTVGKNTDESPEDTAKASVKISKIPQNDTILAAKNTSINVNSHLPIISKVKEERVRTASAEIKSVFGGTDEVFMETIKDINPYIYNNLNGLPLQRGSGNNILTAGSCIDLLSDDDCEDIGQLISETSTKDVSAKGTNDNSKSSCAKSPNLFETSLNDSNEEGQTSNIQEPEVLDTGALDSHQHESPKTVSEEEETNRSYEPNCDDEEFMFSQIVIDDMKAELANEDIEDLMIDLENVAVELQKTGDTLQQAPVILPTIKKELDTSCWSVDDADEDDYDVELETKVSDWSAKLFSQSLTQANMSQVYEIEDDGDEDESKESNTNNNICEEDGDNDSDFYTRMDNDNFIDDLYISLKEKCSTNNTELATTDNEIPVAPITNIVDSPVIRKSSLKTKRVVDSSDEEEVVKDKIDKSKNETNQELGRIKPNHKEAEPYQLVKPLRNEKTSDSKYKDISSTKMQKRRKSTNVCEKPKNEKTEIERRMSVAVDRKETEIIAMNDVLSKSSAKPVQPSSIKEINIFTPVSKTEKPKIIRGPPSIIDAPNLPKHKGKLRGVSASPVNAKQKLNSIREKITIENISKDLKRKWNEKSSVTKKREKERSKIIKESRKERLKELAKTQQNIAEASRKRKAGTDKDVDGKGSCFKKPKVKITSVNRGAFLTKESEQPSKRKTFKIPKLPKPESATESTSATIIGKESEASVSKTKVANSDITYFAKALCEPDLLLLKPKKPATVAPLNTTTARCSTDSNDPPQIPNSSVTAVCKESAAARAKRTTNKITFASMQRNFVESHQNQKDLEFISNKRTCLTDTVKRDEDVGRKKKKVRFNDTPIVHYIERTCGANKKVDKKDVLPQSTINDRRQIIRTAFPLVDRTSNIISKFLTWGNEWLEKRNADAQAAGETIFPMPNQFSSFESYKSVLFPLMKLEFLCNLEREYKQCSIKPFNVTMDNATQEGDRWLLFTKYNTKNKSRSDIPKCDLVILDFNDKSTGTFAYLNSKRKGIACDTFTFEIMSKNYTKSFLDKFKEINVRPVVDNIRIEFGAFNAVYQLESTPLFKKILNPLELLNCKSVPNRKIKYKGFHPLNTKQEQILLTTYAKIIDETTPNITLIKGPPGTGKSCLITNLALQSMYGEEVRCMDKKILICAQSNVAVDVIAAKLFDVQQRMRPEIRFRIIRYGIPDRISPELAPITLQQIVLRDHLKRQAQNNKTIDENKENIKNQMHVLEAQIFDMQNRNIKGTVEEDELIEKNKQLQLMRNILNQNMRPEDERSICTWHLTNANIVCTTLSSCVKLSQYVNYFDICIIDEATQCTEPWTLLPLKFGINSLVLVGDTQQLPATVLSKKAMDLGFANSMFTRLQRCLEAVEKKNVTPSNLVCSLQTQYRMHPEICRWPNLYFYKNELINAPCTQILKTPIAPFSVINLAYSQNEHCNYGKIENNLEAEFVVNLLRALDGYIPNKYNSYGVITPYAQHRIKLEASLKSSGLTNIMVNTIDSYQGLEKDVIVISNARTHGIGFLSNYQRLNVALTRPRKCLILCGNFKNLESVPSWRSILNNARERKVFHEVSAACAQDIHRNVIEKIKLKH